MQPIALSGTEVQSLECAAKAEWLVTNGLGGYAAGTAAGINTRRYHGVLLAAPKPENRELLVAQVQEELHAGDQVWQLGAAYYPDVVHPQGFQHLLRFTVDPCPTWTYSCGPHLLEKSLTMVRGQNVTAIRYRLLSGGQLHLLVRPMVAGRYYHALRRESPAAFATEQTGDWLVIRSGPDRPPLFLAGSGRFQPRSVWYRAVRYPVEEARGLDWEEDLYVPGELWLEMQPGSVAWLLAVAQDVSPPEPGTLVEQAFAAAAVRPQLLLHRAGNPRGAAARLVVAADDYVIARGESVSIIAGYPWFTDWGRDAMISLPGLLLATGRAREALSVLETFATAEAQGLIPNRFPDQAAEPEYNTVDAPLWFIYACERYLAHTGDRRGLAGLWPTVVNIIEGYMRGTLFGIGVDDRGLVKAGQPGYQLTWMDAKVGDWVVTPRAGYPVEISALWHNALLAAAELGEEYDPAFAADCRRWAALTRENFPKVFWLPDQGYLADVVSLDGKQDASLRPNQILAVSLPYPVLAGEKAAAVVAQVWEHLYTPLGLRSLARHDPGYRGVYAGDQTARDSAYHCGTVWAWLIGPFISAYLRVNGRTPITLAVARRLLAPLLDHLNYAGLGHVSEIFDGDPPHAPGGCFAQAWSVAELLRLWAEEFARADLEITAGGDCGAPVC